MRVETDSRCFGDDLPQATKNTGDPRLKNKRAIILPQLSALEASLVKNAIIYPANSILKVCAHLSWHILLNQYESSTQPQAIIYTYFAKVKGLNQTKRALEIAAAGGNSDLISGPSGTSKYMVFGYFAGILHSLTESEALEAAAIQSPNGNYKLENWKRISYRTQHHTASDAALVGSGGISRPGEISLAHHGVLFLDELPEFGRKVLEVLREPLESGKITICRAERQADFPASFQLLASMNPCPCGYLGHFNNKCRCTADNVARYRGKISGPLLDRIDLLIEVPALKENELISAANVENSESIRNRVEKSREIQLKYQDKAKFAFGSLEIDEYCLPDDAGMTLLKAAISKLNLSARAYHRLLKVARTIADLAADAAIKPAHIAEAVLYRRGETS